MAHQIMCIVEGRCVISITFEMETYFYLFIYVFNSFLKLAAVYVVDGFNPRLTWSLISANDLKWCGLGLNVNISISLA